MRFSIRGILLATAFIAVLLSTFVAPPVIGSAIILLLWPLVTTFVVGVAIYSRGFWQAFAIGAAVPTAFLGSCTYLLIVIVSIDSGRPVWNGLIEILDEVSLGMRLLMPFTAVIALACGGINVGVRRLLSEERQP